MSCVSNFIQRNGFGLECVHLGTLVKEVTAKPLSSILGQDPIYFCASCAMGDYIFSHGTNRKKLAALSQLPVLSIPRDVEQDNNLQE